MRTIDADALKELFSEVIGHIAKKPEMNGNLEHMIRASTMVIQMIDDAPTVQPDTTTHDSIPAETGKNDGGGTSGDCISRAQAIDALRAMQTYKLFAGDDMILIDKAQAQTELMMLPSAEPERKTVFNRDIAIEAICDEVMLWFDISATKAYEIAETAVKRIEVRMEKTNRGEKE